MTVPGALKPNHKPVKAYYEALAAYGAHGVDHEGATETAFQRLLADHAKSLGWMLIPKESLKHDGKSVIPTAPSAGCHWRLRPV
jgi:hypothetical protein